MFTQRSLNVHRTFIECSLGLHLLQWAMAMKIHRNMTASGIMALDWPPYNRYGTTEPNIAQTTNAQQETARSLPEDIEDSHGV